jgi:hypothetical protein
MQRPMRQEVMFFELVFSRLHHDLGIPAALSNGPARLRTAAMSAWFIHFPTQYGGKPRNKIQTTWAAMGGVRTAYLQRYNYF